jgi:hypothetical protein
LNSGNAAYVREQSQHIIKIEGNQHWNLILLYRNISDAFRKKVEIKHHLSKNVETEISHLSSQTAFLHALTLFLGHSYMIPAL